MTHARMFFAVIIGLFTLAALAMVGIVVLLVADKQVPDVLGYAITATFTGAVGMLARSPREEDPEPVPVEVVNVPADPVPVADARASRKRP